MVERDQEHLEEHLTDILNRHSEGLIWDADRSDDLLEEHAETFPALAGLMAIAQRLRETLVPVRPDEEFVAELRTRLQTMNEADNRTVTVWSRLRNRLSRHSAVLGTVISILAVLAMAIRVVGSLVMVVVLLTGNRRRRTAAA